MPGGSAPRAGLRSLFARKPKRATAAGRSSTSDSNSDRLLSRVSSFAIYLGRISASRAHDVRRALVDSRDFELVVLDPAAVDIDLQDLLAAAAAAESCSKPAAAASSTAARVRFIARFDLAEAAGDDAEDVFERWKEAEAKGFDGVLLAGVESAKSPSAVAALLEQLAEQKPLGERPLLFLEDGPAVFRQPAARALLAGVLLTDLCINPDGSPRVWYGEAWRKTREYRDELLEEMRTRAGFVVLAVGVAPSEQHARPEVVRRFANLTSEYPIAGYFSSDPTFKDLGAVRPLRLGPSPLALLSSDPQVRRLDAAGERAGGLPGVPEHLLTREEAGGPAAATSCLSAPIAEALATAAHRLAERPEAERKWTAWLAESAAALEEAGAGREAVTLLHQAAAAESDVMSELAGSTDNDAQSGVVSTTLQLPATWTGDPEDAGASDWGWGGGAAAIGQWELCCGVPSEAAIRRVIAVQRALRIGGTLLQISAPRVAEAFEGGTEKNPQRPLLQLEMREAIALLEAAAADASPHAPLLGPFAASGPLAGAAPFRLLQRVVEALRRGEGRPGPTVHVWSSDHVSLAVDTAEGPQRFFAVAEIEADPPALHVYVRRPPEPHAHPNVAEAVLFCALRAAGYPPAQARLLSAMARRPSGRDEESDSREAVPLSDTTRAEVLLASLRELQALVLSCAPRAEAVERDERLPPEERTALASVERCVLAAALARLSSHGLRSSARGRATTKAIRQAEERGADDPWLQLVRRSLWQPKVMAETLRPLLAALAVGCDVCCSPPGAAARDVIAAPIAALRACAFDELEVTCRDRALSSPYFVNITDATTFYLEWMGVRGEQAERVFGLSKYRLCENLLHERVRRRLIEEDPDPDILWPAPRQPTVKGSITLHIKKFIDGVFFQIPLLLQLTLFAALGVGPFNSRKLEPTVGICLNIALYVSLFFAAATSQGLALLVYAYKFQASYSLMSASISQMALASLVLYFVGGGGTAVAVFYAFDDGRLAAVFFVYVLLFSFFVSLTAVLYALHPTGSSAWKSAEGHAIIASALAAVFCSLLLDYNVQHGDVWRREYNHLVALTVADALLGFFTAAQLQHRNTAFNTIKPTAEADVIAWYARRTGHPPAPLKSSNEAADNAACLEWWTRAEGTLLTVEVAKDSEALEAARKARDSFLADARAKFAAECAQAAHRGRFMGRWFPFLAGPATFDELVLPRARNFDAERGIVLWAAGYAGKEPPRAFTRQWDELLREGVAATTLKRRVDGLHRGGAVFDATLPHAIAGALFFALLFSDRLVRFFHAPLLGSMQYNASTNVAVFVLIFMVCMMETTWARLPRLARSWNRLRVGVDGATPQEVMLHEERQRNRLFFSEIARLGLVSAFVSGLGAALLYFTESSSGYFHTRGWVLYAVACVAFFGLQVLYFSDIFYRCCWLQWTEEHVKKIKVAWAYAAGCCVGFPAGSIAVKMTNDLDYALLAPLAGAWAGVFFIKLLLYLEGAHGWFDGIPLLSRRAARFDDPDPKEAAEAERGARCVAVRLVGQPCPAAPEEIGALAARLARAGPGSGVRVVSSAVRAAASFLCGLASRRLGRGGFHSALLSAVPAGPELLAEAHDALADGEGLQVSVVSEAFAAVDGSHALVSGLAVAGRYPLAALYVPAGWYHRSSPARLFVSEAAVGERPAAAAVAELMLHALDKARRRVDPEAAAFGPADDDAPGGTGATAAELLLSEQDPPAPDYVPARFLPQLRRCDGGALAALAARAHSSAAAAALAGVDVDRRWADLPWGARAVALACLAGSVRRAAIAAGEAALRAALAELYGRPVEPAAWREACERGRLLARLAHAIGRAAREEAAARPAEAPALELPEPEAAPKPLEGGRLAPEELYVRLPRAPDSLAARALEQLHLIARLWFLAITGDPSFPAEYGYALHGPREPGPDAAVRAGCLAWPLYPLASHLMLLVHAAARPVAEALFWGIAMALSPKLRALQRAIERGIYRRELRRDGLVAAVQCNLFDGPVTGFVRRAPDEAGRVLAVHVLPGLLDAEPKRTCVGHVGVASGKEGGKAALSLAGCECSFVRAEYDGDGRIRRRLHYRSNAVQWTAFYSYDGSREGFPEHVPSAKRVYQGEMFEEPLLKDGEPRPAGLVQEVRYDATGREVAAVVYVRPSWDKSSPQPVSAFHSFPSDDPLADSHAVAAEYAGVPLGPRRTGALFVELYPHTLLLKQVEVREEGVPTLRTTYSWGHPSHARIGTVNADTGEPCETPELVAKDTLGLISRLQHVASIYQEDLLAPLPSSSDREEFEKPPRGWRRKRRFRSVASGAMPTAKARTALWRAWAAGAVDGAQARQWDEALLRAEPMLRRYWRLRDWGLLEAARAELQERESDIVAAIAFNNEGVRTLMALRTSDLFDMCRGGASQRYSIAEAEAPAGAGAGAEGADPDDPALFARWNEAAPLPVTNVDTGTWPMDGGGVAACRRDLVDTLPRLRWDAAIELGTEARLVPDGYNVSRNVRSLQFTPLWHATGLPEAQQGEHELATLPYGLLAARRWRTSSRVIRRFFVPVLRRMLALHANPRPTRRELDLAIVAYANFALYLRTYDFNATAGSAEARAVYTRFWLEDAYRMAQSGPFARIEMCNVEELESAYEYMLRHVLRPYGSTPVANLVTHASHHGIQGALGVAAKVMHGSGMINWDHSIAFREFIRFVNDDKCLHQWVKYGICCFFRGTMFVNYHAADTIVSCCATFNRDWEAHMGGGRGHDGRTVAMRRKLSPVVNGMLMGRFAPRRESERPRPTSVMVSHVNVLKDIKTAIQAAKVIVEEYGLREYQLLVYGDTTKDPAHAADCRAFILANGLETNVTLCGLGNAPIVLPRGWLMLNSSRSEGLPLALGEAGLCGLPVVCTDVAGSKEIIQVPEDPSRVFGALVPPVDHAALARAQLEVFCMTGYLPELAGEPRPGPSLDALLRGGPGALRARMAEAKLLRQRLGMRYRANVAASFGLDRYKREHEQQIWAWAVRHRELQARASPSPRGRPAPRRPRCGPRRPSSPRRSRRSWRSGRAPSTCRARRPSTPARPRRPAARPARALAILAARPTAPDLLAPLWEDERRAARGRAVSERLLAIRRAQASAAEPGLVPPSPSDVVKSARLLSAGSLRRRAPAWRPPRLPGERPVPLLWELTAESPAPAPEPEAPSPLPAPEPLPEPLSEAEPEPELQPQPEPEPQRREVEVEAVQAEASPPPEPPVVAMAPEEEDPLPACEEDPPALDIELAAPERALPRLWEYPEEEPAAPAPSSPAKLVPHFWDYLEEEPGPEPSYARDSMDGLFPPAAFPPRPPTYMWDYPLAVEGPAPAPAFPVRDLRYPFGGGLYQLPGEREESAVEAVYRRADAASRAFKLTPAGLAAGLRLPEGDAAAQAAAEAPAAAGTELSASSGSKPLPLMLPRRLPAWAASQRAEPTGPGRAAGTQERPAEGGPGREGPAAPVERPPAAPIAPAIQAQRTPAAEPEPAAAAPAPITPKTPVPARAAEIGVEGDMKQQPLASLPSSPAPPLEAPAASPAAVPAEPPPPPPARAAPPPYRSSGFSVAAAPPRAAGAPNGPLGAKLSEFGGRQLQRGSQNEEDRSSAQQRPRRRVSPAIAQRLEGFEAGPRPGAASAPPRVRAQPVSEESATSAAGQRERPSPRVANPAEAAGGLEGPPKSPESDRASPFGGPEAVDDAASSALEPPAKDGSGVPAQAVGEPADQSDSPAKAAGGAEGAAEDVAVTVSRPLDGAATLGFEEGGKLQAGGKLGSAGAAGALLGLPLPKSLALLEGLPLPGRAEVRVLDAEEEAAFAAVPAAPALADPAAARAALDLFFCGGGKPKTDPAALRRGPRRLQLTE
eukprot:tig00020604_g11844.t1